VIPALQFIGASGAVTRSKFPVESGGRRILVDCGLYQGLRRYGCATGTGCRWMSVRSTGSVITHQRRHAGEAYPNRVAIA
jgi:hypothetical protein